MHIYHCLLFIYLFITERCTEGNLSPSVPKISVTAREVFVAGWYLCHPVVVFKRCSDIHRKLGAKIAAANGHPEVINCSKIYFRSPRLPIGGRVLPVPKNSTSPRPFRPRLTNCHPLEKKSCGRPCEKLHKMWQANHTFIKMPGQDDHMQSISTTGIVMLALSSGQRKGKMNENLSFWRWTVEVA